MARKIKTNNLQHWAQNKIFGLFVFNLVVMILIVLRSAGYFSPFFPLTINFIVFVSLILAIFLLNLKSSVFFVIAFIFWVLAAFLRIVNVEVWVERASLYTFQALVVGVVLFIIEVIISSRYSRRKN